VLEVVKAKGHVPFLDMAYQGFGDGIAEDAFAVRLFAESGLEFFVSSSFSKSFSLYGERVGALSIVTASKDESARVLSQVKRVIRTNYSNPPTHGATIVATVLNSPNCARCGKPNWPKCASASTACASRWFRCWPNTAPSATSASLAARRHVLLLRPDR
jgi:aspartate/tyrosine/aromatic aminotransferase